MNRTLKVNHCLGQMCPFLFAKKNFNELKGELTQNTEHDS